MRTRARRQIGKLQHGIVPRTADPPAGVSYSATAAMFVRKAALDLPSPPEAVADEFNLTPAEVRVIFAIVEIGGVPEVAPVLGISDQTVKTHLHRIYQKTATKRQADLVRLVASYSGRL
jgi:DNA-binding CsgD family transcriptional regulator